MPNSTKCMKWQDVKSSLETDSPQVVIRIDDIYGMVILLAKGLGGTLVVFIPGTLNEDTNRKVNENQPGPRHRYLIKTDVTSRQLAYC